jgi:T-complex protein 1 subunit theta
MFLVQVVHPAAKLVAMAAKAQEDEIGDATNLVVVFAGVLLEGAEVLLRQVILMSPSIQIILRPSRLGPSNEALIYSM